MATTRPVRHLLPAVSGRTAITTLACFLLTAAPAGAARAWHAPVDVATAGVAISGARVAVDPRGDAVAVWVVGETSGTGAHLPLGFVQAAVRPAGAAWQAPVAISAVRDAVGADVAIDARGDAIAVWTSAGSTVQSAVLPAGGAWQPPVDISLPGAAGALSGAQVAIDPAGDAVAVWSRQDQAISVVQSAARPAGGAWQAPVDISAAGRLAFGADVAVDPQGDAVAVWSHEAAGGAPIPVGSAVRTAGGAWQPPVDIPMTAADSRGPGGARVAVDAQGDAVAVWQRSDSGNGGGIAQGAARPAGGTWQPFDLSGEGPSINGVALAVDGQGDAVSIWNRATGTAGVVQGAARPVGGTWQATADLSSAGQIAGGADVAVDQQGNAVAVWELFGSDKNGVAQSAVRPAGGAWQAPIAVSAAGHYAHNAQVAVDADGDAVAIWIGSSGGKSAVESAVYDAAAQPPPPPPPARAKVAKLRLSPSRFRAARSGASVRATAARVATRVSYVLSTPASVRFTVRRLRGGHLVSDHCVKPARSNRGHKSCIRSVRVPGSFTRQRSAGTDRFTFSGRLAGRALKPGVYKLVATATAGGHSGSPASARFRIVR
jgi:hypothetical protein